MSIRTEPKRCNEHRNELRRKKVAERKKREAILKQPLPWTAGPHNPLGLFGGC